MEIASRQKVFYKPQSRGSSTDAHHWSHNIAKKAEGTNSEIVSSSGNALNRVVAYFSDDVVHQPISPKRFSLAAVLPRALTKAHDQRFRYPHITLSSLFSSCGKEGPQEHTQVQANCSILIFEHSLQDIAVST